MAEDVPRNLGFGSYRLGTSYGIKEGLTPPIGLNQAINWGAPQVELGAMERSMGEIGRSGRQVIKELAKANEIDLTFHVPINQEHELAMPNKKVNSEAIRKMEVALDFVKDTGAKLINIHPTQVINRADEDTIYIYDNHSGEASPARIPERIRKQAEAENKNPVEMFIQETNELKTKQIRDTITEREYYGKHYHEQAKAMEPFTKGLPVAKQYWDKLSEQGREAIAAAVKLIDADTSSDKITQEVIDKVTENHRMLQDRAKAAQEYAGILRKEYKEFIEGEKPTPWIRDGNEKMMENFVDNFAPLAKKAIDMDVQVGIENTDSRFIFGTSEETNEIINMVGKKLEGMGVSKEKLKTHLGTTFDMGHASSMKGLKVRGKDGKVYTLEGKPEEMIKQFKNEYGNIIHIHASENFGEMDAHLPQGQAYTDEQREAMEKYLKESGFKGRIMHEVGGLGGLSYAVSLEKLSPHMYAVGGVPTSAMFGPSYQMTDPTEGLFFPGEKRENYFYGSWVGGHI